MKLSFKRIGLAKGLNWVFLSSPKYYFRHVKRRVGNRLVLLNVFNREGVYIYLVSRAGYAKNIPIGLGTIFFFRIKASKEHAKFPPADYPAKIILFGFILK